MVRLLLIRPRTSGWPSAQRPLPAPLPQSRKLCARRAEVVHGEVGCRFSYQQDPPTPRSSHRRDPPQEPRGPSWGQRRLETGERRETQREKGCRVQGASSCGTCPTLAKIPTWAREGQKLGAGATESEGSPCAPHSPSWGHRCLGELRS